MIGNSCGNKNEPEYTNFKSLSREQLSKLNQKHGKPYIAEKGKKRAKLNFTHWAERVMLEHLIMFHPQTHSFYQYLKKDGVRHVVDDKKMLYYVADSLRHAKAGKHRTFGNFSAILKMAQGQAQSDKDIFVSNSLCIHCLNRILEYDSAKQVFIEKDFSPEYYSRNQIPFNYDPTATCPTFIRELLESAMSHDDIDHLQQYIGQCLLNKNRSQTFLLAIGMPGGGKSTLVNIIENLVGRESCTELRLEHMDNRFEVGRLIGKTLLTGKDVDSSFLEGLGARKLKALTGNDTLTAELKGQNKRIDVIGNFNVIITSNNNLRLKFDGDKDAWRRRIILIKYENPPPEEVIVDFDKKLLQTEGSGILNWAIAGALKVLETGGKIKKSKQQEASVNEFLVSSNPFEYFANKYIHSVPGAALLSEDVTTEFLRFCNDVGWEPLRERDILNRFHAYMQKKHRAKKRYDIKRDGRNKRGYVGFQICKKQPI